MPKGQWTPPDAGEDAPAEVKDILAKVYSDFRDEHPAEDPAVKAQGAQIAWGAVKRAGWEKGAEGKWEKKPAKESAVFDSPFSRFRLVEAGKKGELLIDVHIIGPGWGSSGYYSEAVLKKACESGVYPEGMHMHIDHPTRAAEKEQPARTIKGESPLAAVLTEAGHYDPKGWDGPGVYAKARVMPQYVEDIKAMDGHRDLALCLGQVGGWRGRGQERPHHPGADRGFAQYGGFRDGSRGRGPLSHAVFGDEGRTDRPDRKHEQKEGRKHGN